MRLWWRRKEDGVLMGYGRNDRVLVDARWQ